MYKYARKKNNQKRILINRLVNWRCFGGEQDTLDREESSHGEEN